MRARVRRAAILTLIVLAAGETAVPTDTAMRIRIGEKAPEFRLPDLLTGIPASLWQFKEVVRCARAGGYHRGDPELASVTGDLVKEMEQGNDRTASRPR
jgi:hypothetical protein